MRRQVQTLARWMIAILAVSVPLSYLLWQWRYSEHKELAGLSYEAFSAKMSADTSPQYWDYALYIIIVTTTVVSLVALVANGLRLIFPSPPEASKVAKSSKADTKKS